MTRTHTWRLFCADCGKGMHRSPTSLPQGKAKCHGCRRANRPEPKPKRIPGTGKSWRDCEVCGQRYRKKMKEQRTCSRTCGAEIRKPSPRVEKLQVCQLDWTQCLTCQVWIGNARKRVCGQACAAKRAAASAIERYVSRSKPTTVACTDCGEDHTTPTARNGGLCKRCQKRRYNARYGHTDRKRARLHGVEYEPIDRLKVYERDRWRCGLCRKPVKRAAKVPHPLAPSLDHIVPLSEGGDHLYPNVQCAHFICNATKGAGGSQQLALVG